ncbi:DNA cytosine methyltransferase [Paenibacillus anaericanus]|uniref:Cytosine-specific methyltransferase n=1 Tax=Paenibacillus anaericanus TaxID=170367 RepID=A0A3S1BL00_9BACL|nr:DNA cytosine methyltransferase [Paenibacillus anaericanus]RUT43730.1 DNA cytosine methyltransferase [Paenibacillus anaericanus]
MHKKPVAIDLFSGAGGLTLGFEMAGFTVKAAVEIDNHACEAHKINFPNCEVIKEDISLVNKEKIQKTVGLDNEIEVVFGGPPCQGFSMAGRRASDDIRNELLNEFSRIVMDIKPKFFVMENVKGLISYKAGETLNQFLKSVSELYSIITPIKVLNAADFGVPQNRERVFILGTRKDIECELMYPQPTHIRPKDNRFIYNPNFVNHSSLERMDNMNFCPTVSDAIGDLPNPDLYEELIEGDCVRYRNEGVLYTSNYAQIMKGLVKDPNDKSTIRPDWDSNIITNYKRTMHEQRIREEFTNLIQGEVHRSRRKKLNADGLSPTIRAGTKSDKGSYTALRSIHYEQPRVITVREAARLMSFPDWMYFHPTKWHGFRLVGNAVPPLMAREVALQIIKAMVNLNEKKECQ